MKPIDPNELIKTWPKWKQKLAGVRPPECKHTEAKCGSCVDWDSDSHTCMNTWPIDHGSLCIKCGRCCYMKDRLGHPTREPCCFLVNNLCVIYDQRHKVPWCCDPVAAVRAGHQVLPLDCPVYLSILKEKTKE